MTIDSIRLQQFRSYDDATFTFAPQVSIVVGPNGSGKTNLLEAVFVLATGKSFRVQDVDLLHYNAQWLRLDARSGELERTLTIRQGDQRLEKQLLINDTARRFTAAQRLPVVLFEPRDMQLLTGSPERRRAFLDDILVLLTPTYEGALVGYRRALLQRNKLLKQYAGRTPPADQLFVWNVRLSEFGAQLISERQGLIARLNQKAGDFYRQLSDSSAHTLLAYQTQLQTDQHKLSSQFLHALESVTKKDVQRGFTSVGPHRDDLQVLLDGADAQVSASRGETRTLVMMLKILEAHLIQEHIDQKPLILLDDVFSELDTTRRRMLADHLHDHQTIITTTHADSAMIASTKSAHHLITLPSR